tara:strand:- start:132 stop:932 length:801 start_codon:yes stop_codon:yes gene_type:complete
MVLTPNSEVSRTANIRASASDLAAALNRASLDKPSNPVRVLFTEDGVSIWTHDLAKTVQVLVTDSQVDSLKVKEPCVLLVDPGSLSQLLSTKFGNSIVKITTEAHAPITIRDKTGNQVVFHPADEDDCFSIPDHWVLPKNGDGWFTLPMKDDEVCSTRITIEKDQLLKGITDMKVAGAPYVVFNFEETKSSCGSGQWGSKTNQSHSPIIATVEGEKAEICFTDNLADIVKKLDGGTFELQKHTELPFVVITGNSTTIVATEAVREV